MLKVISINKINKKDKVIFVTRIDLIGDYLHSRNFLKSLRNCKKFKDYKIVLLVNEVLKDIVLDFDSKYIDEVIFIKNKMLKRCYFRFILKKLINRYHYEYALNYMTIRNIDSEIVMKLVNAKNKYGINGSNINLSKEKMDEYNKFYTKVFDNCQMDYCYGGEDFLFQITGEKTEPTLHFILDEKKFDKFQLKKPYAILFPSASLKEKRLDFSKFLAAANYFYEYVNNLFLGGGICYIIGNRKDNEIFKGYNLTDFPFIKNYCGKYKLSELPYIFKDADLILTNDTCGMWFGKYSGNKNIIVFCHNQKPQKNLLIREKDKYENNVYVHQSDGFNFIFPRISADAVYFDEDEKLTIYQDINKIEMSDIYYNIDKIMENLYSK